MMKDIENKFVFTKQIHDEYIRCAYWRSPRRIILFIFFIALFVSSILAAVAPHPDPTADVWGVLAMVGILFYCLLYTFSKKGYTSIIRRNKGEVTFNTLLAEDKISQMQTSNATHFTAKYEYADISTVRKTRNLIILFFNHGASCILLKSGFTEASAEDALQLLKSKNDR